MGRIQVFTKIIDGKDFIFRRSLDPNTNSIAYSITDATSPSRIYLFKKNAQGEWETQNENLPGELKTTLKGLISRNEVKN